LCSVPIVAFITVSEIKLSEFAELSESKKGQHPRTQRFEIDRPCILATECFEV